MTRPFTFKDCEFQAKVRLETVLAQLEDEIEENTPYDSAYTSGLMRAREIVKAEHREAKRSVDGKTSFIELGAGIGGIRLAFEQAGATVLDLGVQNFDICTRTLTAGYGKDGKEILILDHVYKKPRRLTPRECARLMGFPDSFLIPVSDRQAYKQFGNSVVVPLVKEIAENMLVVL